MAGAALAEWIFRRLSNRIAPKSPSIGFTRPDVVKVRYSGSSIIFTRHSTVVECRYSEYDIADSGRWFLEILHAPSALSDDDAIVIILDGLAFRLASRQRDGGFEIKRNGRQILNFPATDPPENEGVFAWIFMKFVLVLLSPIILLIRIRSLATRVKYYFLKTPPRSSRASPPR
jgi:hypothetical protein